MSIEKIREKFIKARTTVRMRFVDWRDTFEKEFEEALAELSKPKCPTCQDTGIITIEICSGCGGKYRDCDCPAGSASRDIPCPDCQPEPTGFTKTIRREAMKDKDYSRRAMMLENRHLLLQAADEIDRMTAENKKLKGKKDHPEHYCHKCGGKNISWYVDNNLWNEVIGSGGILCPLCFVSIAEEKGINPIAWRLSREGDEPEVNKLRVKNNQQAERIKELEQILNDSHH